MTASTPWSSSHLASATIVAVPCSCGLCRSHLHFRLPICLEPRQHLLCEDRQVAHCMFMAQKGGVAHHQKVAHAAAVFTKAHYLVVDPIRRATEQDAGIDQVLHARAMHVDHATVFGEAARRGLTLEHARVVLSRQEPRWIAKRHMHD